MANFFARNKSVPFQFPSESTSPLDVMGIGGQDLNITCPKHDTAMEEGEDPGTMRTDDLFAAISQVTNKNSNPVPNETPLKFNCFLTNQHSFEKVVTLIESTLRAQVSNTFSFAYFMKEQTFKVRQVDLGNAREDHIWIYYDSSRGDNVVEVQRVSGDGMHHFQVNVLSLLKSTFNPSAKCQQPTVSFRTDFTLSPLSKSAFHNAISPMLNMARDLHVENRIESSKMLCQVFNQESHIHMLTQVENKETLLFPCLEVICDLLRDPNPEIVECATIAFTLFLEQLVSLKLFVTLRTILDSEDLGSLLCLGIVSQILGIDATPENEEHYLHAIRRRHAAKSLLLLTQYDVNFVREVLRLHFNVTSREEFVRCAARVVDKIEGVSLQGVCDLCFPLR
jgi:hypothetical protein